MPEPRSVLLIGVNPEEVDFTDPSLPPGMSAEKIHAGLRRAHALLTEQGYVSDQCMVSLKGGAQEQIVEALGRKVYTCVVIGGGVRKPEPNLALFERIINTVHKHAPGAVIAFNTRPEDSAEAVARVLPKG
ncbi:hypothetical protein [Stigmatella aurantiaca]|uniref:Conserved uncharacterized protein n=1 Tax=Stigmatella aurantiaca (strain DW4/3-1) TaxID=378806 RepID=Q09AZ0_STIAD|nr:hypothetical protein [Stigmatella aurantiaca]ADO72389.1 conserved uncharacterized protein [Stigmatella aurantiaca DW4/3-1]EAU68849.1 conserved hypothetical protein [Stigmatella aurantiaca DW4/3-1]